MDLSRSQVRTGPQLTGQHEESVADGKLAARVRLEPWAMSL